MLKPIIRLASRAYPKGAARSEFLESTASDLHYATELDIDERAIERGAIKQALSYGWRHPRIGVVLTIAGMLFSVWLCTKWVAYPEPYAVANGVWLALTWSIAVLCSRVPGSRLTKPAILAFLLLVVAFVIKTSEWHSYGIVDYATKHAGPPILVNVHSDYGSFVMLFVALSSTAYVWACVLLLLDRAVVRGILALAFAAAQVYWFYSSTQLMFFWELQDQWARRLPLWGSAWVIFFAVSAWQGIRAKRGAAQPQR